MGLDLIVGLSDTEHYVMEWGLIDHCISKAGLETYRDSTEAFPPHPYGRAYFLRWFADAVRKRGGDFNHLRRLSLSEHQYILPLDFNDPIPVFDEKRPSDFGFREREMVSFADYERQRVESVRKEFPDGFMLGPGYPYYLNTPLHEIFLLSAPRLIKECVKLFNEDLPGWSQEGEFWDAHCDHPLYDGADSLNAFLFSSHYRQTVWFSG